jgi:recombination protein RecR
MIISDSPFFIFSFTLSSSSFWRIFFSGFFSSIGIFPEKKIRQNELLERLQKDLDIKEIILALDCNPDGENTEKYIKDLIESTVKREDIKISHLGRGISTGAELEYLDPETIKNALKNRQ